MSATTAGPTRHPLATTALVLGLLNTVCFAPAPLAWALGARAVRQIDASGGRLAGRAAAQAGCRLGMTGTAVLAVALVWLVAR